MSKGLASQIVKGEPDECRHHHSVTHVPRALRRQAIIWSAFSDPPRQPPEGSAFFPLFVKGEHFERL